MTEVIVPASTDGEASSGADVQGSVDEQLIQQLADPLLNLATDCVFIVRFLGKPSLSNPYSHLVAVDMKTAATIRPRQRRPGS